MKTKPQRAQSKRKHTPHPRQVPRASERASEVTRQPTYETHAQRGYTRDTTRARMTFRRDQGSGTGASKKLETVAQLPDRGDVSRLSTIHRCVAWLVGNIWVVDACARGGISASIRVTAVVGYAHAPPRRCTCPSPREAAAPGMREAPACVSCPPSKRGLCACGLRVKPSRQLSCGYTTAVR